MSPIYVHLLLQYLLFGSLMASPRGLSTPRALKVKKELETYFGHEIGVL